MQAEYRVEHIDLMNCTINIGGRLIDFSTPKVMAIVNITSDSFYSSSRSTTEEALSAKLDWLDANGADMIDIGACSTRPGSTPISAEDEWERLSRALNVISKRTKRPIVSVDTFRAEIAQRAVKEYGVDIINDISGGELDKNMFSTIRELQVVYVLTCYRSQVLVEELSNKVNELHLMGVSDIIVDPGLGFNKTLNQNWTILSSIDMLKPLDCPILIGLSRKSMIQNVLSVSVQDALNGTTAANMIALMRGADILRVHDLTEAKQTITIYQQINK